MRFDFPGMPIAQARPRLGRFGVYNPQSKIKIAHRKLCSELMRAQLGHPIAEGPIGAYTSIKCPLPASWCLKKRSELENKPVSRRPDLDNYEKFLFDVLSTIAYKDDAQIASSYVEKTYSCTPGVSINLWPLQEGFMISEHAISYKEKVSIEDLCYLIKKANRLGTSGRKIARTYQQEDEDGFHVYFEVEGLKEKQYDD